MSSKSIKLSSLIIGALLFLVSCSSQAVSINTDSSGVAIKGYDTVAYFTQGQPTPGKKEFQHMWKGAKWLFGNEEHLKLFKENPIAYAPQFGGY